MKKHLLAFCLLASSYTFSLAQERTPFQLYGGDTLNGFDIKACQDEAIRLHFGGRDLIPYIWQKEQAFVNAKYQLKEAPHLVERTAAIQVKGILSSACNNVDFENGNFSGWVGAIGYNRNSAAALTQTAAGINTLGQNSKVNSCSYHTLLTGAGTDPYTGVPVVDPSGGTYSARLGGDWLNICSAEFTPYSPCTSGRYSSTRANSGGELLQQTFVVTASNSMFSYKYSVVMDSIDHTSGQQPYFRVEVLDSVNKPLPCLQYYVESINGVAPMGFVSAAKKDTNLDHVPGYLPSPPTPVFYCPWTSNSLNLSAYVGHTITVRFTAAGCTVGGHFCYAYVDASCGSVHITSTGSATCAGQKDTLAAPPVTGGSYQWSTLPSGTAGIVGSTTNQTVIVNAPGTYQVTVTQPNGCIYKIDTTLTFPGLPGVTAVPLSPTCSGGNNGSATVTVSSGTGPFTYSWSPAPGGGQGTTTATGLAAGTYTILVTSPSGCSTSTTVTVTNPSALAVSNAPTSVSCNGGSNGAATATASGGTGTLTYSWSPSGGSNATASGLSAGTYTCTVTDANGCTKTTIATIVAPAVLSATGTPTPASCNGAASGSATANVTGGTTNYTYSWSPSGGTAAVAAGLVAGTYTCFVTDKNNCSTSTTAIVTDPPVIALSPSSTPTPCLGNTGSASVVASGGTGAFTYSWSPVSGAAATLSGIAAGTYTVAVTDANGCLQTTTIPVSNTGGPSGNITASTDVTCFAGSNGTATVNGTGGTGTLTYSWSPTGGSGTAATTASGLPAGTYNINITDGAGCIAVVPVTINQPTQITATSAITNTSCHTGSDGQINLTAAGGTPGYTYSWSPVAGSSNTLIGLTAGTYTVLCTDTKGCAQTFTATVGQPNALSSSNATTAVSCNGGNNGSVTTSPSGGTVNYTYSWSPTGGNGATAAGLPAGNYTCTITDSKGCSITSAAVIGQPAALSATNLVSNVSCNAGSNGAATVTPVGGTSGYTYSWAPIGGTAATASGFVAGTYTCLVTDSHGCIFQDVVNITDPPLLSASSSHTNVLCNGANNGTANVSATGGTPTYSYAWTPVGGNAATATGLAPGNYTCTIDDSKGCLTTSVVVITQPTALFAVVGKGGVPCFGASSGTDTLGVSGGTPGYTYSWTPTGGSSYIGTGLSAGITYTCLVTDASGCSVSKTVVLTQPAAIAGNPTSTPAICVSLNGTASVSPSGGTPPFAYSWSPSGGTGSNATGLAAGAYTCTVTDTNGCVKQVPVTVANSNPVISGSPTSSPAICTAHNGTASVSPANGTSPYTYSWSPSGGNGSVASNLNSGAYSCKITDANGCTQTVPVVVGASTTGIHANFSFNPTSGTSPLPVSFFDHSAPNPTIWAWNFGDGATSSSQNPSTVFNNPGIFSVTETVTDAFGCTSDTTITIDVKPPLSILTAPNFFTPNGDGTNDGYYVTYANLSKFEMKIYDRWGVLMSHLTDPSLHWDGRTISGNLASDGTYYYVIVATGVDSKPYDLKGFITLMR